MVAGRWARARRWRRRAGARGRRGRGRRRSRRCLLLLALYNVVRFGSPTEFGTSYQLAGFNPDEFDFFSLDRLLPGALVLPAAAAPAFGLDFPFITLAPEYPGTLPEGFFVEPVAGCCR